MFLGEIISEEKLGEMEQKCLNVLKFNIDSILFLGNIFIVIVAIIVFCLRRGKSTQLKTPPKVLYYMAKTSFLPDHSEFCKTLIKKQKYDVNCLDVDEKLSLFLCSCLSGNEELVSFMIERGANVQSVSCYGDSGLYLAAYGYVNSKTPDFKILSRLIAAGCDINHQNDGGFTVLHLATLKGRLDLVQFLVLHGADSSIPNNEGMLPVDIALVEGFRDIAEFLMKRNQRKKSSQSVYF